MGERETADTNFSKHLFFSQVIEPSYARASALAPSPPLIRNRACPISALIDGRSRINPTSAGEPERGKPLAPCLWLPPPRPPPQAGGGSAPTYFPSAALMLV